MLTKLFTKYLFKIYKKTIVLYLKSLKTNRIYYFQTKLPKKQFLIPNKTNFFRVLLFFCFHKHRGLLSFRIQPISYKCALYMIFIKLQVLQTFSSTVKTTNLLLTNFEPNIFSYQTQYMLKNGFEIQPILLPKKIIVFVTQKTILIIMVQIYVLRFVYGKQSVNKLQAELDGGYWVQK